MATGEELGECFAVGDASHSLKLQGLECCNQG